MNVVRLKHQMRDYAVRNKLEIPRVMWNSPIWGPAARKLAYRVSKHYGHATTNVNSLWAHFNPMTMREKLLVQAKKAVAERWSKGSIQNWYGMGDVPWCAETWSFIKAKAGSSSPKMAYVPAILEAAAHGRDGLALTSHPLPGDGVIYDWNYDHVSDHIETLLTKFGAVITTAAGNSGPPYVVKNTRTTANVIAWVRVTR